MTKEQKRILELEAALNNALAVLREELSHMERIKRRNYHSSRFERISYTVVACDQILRGDT